MNSVNSISVLSMERIVCLENSSLRLYDSRGRLWKDITMDFVPRSFVMLTESEGVLWDSEGQKYLFDLLTTFHIKSKQQSGGKQLGQAGSEDLGVVIEESSHNTMANKASKLLSMKLNGILPEMGILDLNGDSGGICSCDRITIFVTENRDSVIVKKM